MNSTKIKSADIQDFPVIARMFFTENQKPERQCLHSSIGETPESTLEEMIKWHNQGEFILVSAQQEGVLVGTIGSEFDEALGRGWLWGPMALSQDWPNLFEDLYVFLQGFLPTSIRQFDVFLNQSNKRAINFYLENGYHEDTVAHVYQSSAPNKSLNHDSCCVEMQLEHHEGFAELHNSIFPGTYFSAQRMIEMIGEDRKVFLYTEGNEVLGYVSPVVLADAVGGEIDFLGVREDARRRGIGRILLQRALSWLFEEKNVTPVTLTVLSRNVEARSLYESVGFRLKYTGVGLRKTDAKMRDAGHIP